MLITRLFLISFTFLFGSCSVTPFHDVEKTGSSIELLGLRNGCGDFLKMLGPKELIEAAQYLECKSKDTGQNIKIAQYKVPGRLAAAIEKVLIKEYAMGTLKFLCCGWQPKDEVAGRAKYLGKYFYVTMYSTDTVVSNRVNWSDIPFFYINVETGDY